MDDAKTHQDVEATFVNGVTPVLAVSHVAYQLSNACVYFDAGDAGGGSLEFAPTQWACRGGKNAAGEIVVVKTFVPGATSSGLLVGLAASTSGGMRVTAFGGVSAFASLVPALLAAEASSHVLVIHVTGSVDDILPSVPAGIPVLASAGSNVQEAADVALIVHALAAVTHGPVVHIIDGAGPHGDLVVSAARLPRFGFCGSPTAPASPQNIVVSLPPVGNVKIVTALNAVISAAAPFLSRVYGAFLYDGPLAPGAAVYAAGDAGGVLARAIAGATSPIGVIRPLLLQPWAVAELVALLPRTVAHITGVGATVSRMDSIASALRRVSRPVIVAHHDTCAVPVDGASTAAIISTAASASAAYGKVNRPSHFSATSTVPMYDVALWALSHDGVASTAMGTARLLVSVAAPAGFVGGTASARFTDGTMRRRSSSAEGSTDVAVSLTHLRITRRSAADVAGAAPVRGALAPASINVVVVAHPSLLNSFAIVESLAPGALLLINSAPSPPTPRPVGNTLQCQDNECVDDKPSPDSTGGYTASGRDAVEAAVMELCADDRATILAKRVRVVVIDAVATSAAAGLSQWAGGANGVAIVLQTALFAAASSMPGNASFSAVAAALQAEQISSLPTGASTSALPRLYAAVRRGMVAIAPALLMPSSSMNAIKILPESSMSASPMSFECLDVVDATEPYVATPHSDDGSRGMIHRDDRGLPIALSTVLTTTTSLSNAVQMEKRAADGEAARAAQYGTPSRPAVPTWPQSSLPCRVATTPWAHEVPQFGVGPVDFTNDAVLPRVAAGLQRAPHMHAALALAFPDAYSAVHAPAAAAHTPSAASAATHHGEGSVYVAHITENVRLTPVDYDRNGMRMHLLYCARNDRQ